MGLIDKISEIFSGSKTNQTTQVQIDDTYEKSRLAERIVDLVDKIKRINSFDSSVWNLSNTSSYQLQRRSLDELKRLNSSLESRLSELQKQNQQINPKREALEKSKWTGEKPGHMSEHDFDRFQRDDAR